MRAAAVAIVLGAAAGSASAGPLLGIGYGMSHSAAPFDVSDQNVVDTESLALIGRVPLSRPLYLQGEVSKVESYTQGTYGSVASDTTMRSASALLVLDLAHGDLVPILLVGLGVDVAQPGPDTFSQGTTTYTHEELGFGLEYRARGGLVLGIDGRVGNRSGPSPGPVAYTCPPDVACPDDPPADSVALSAFPSGQYYALRVMLGVSL